MCSTYAVILFVSILWTFCNVKVHLSSTPILRLPFPDKRDCPYLWKATTRSSIRPWTNASNVPSACWPSESRCRRRADIVSVQLASWGPWGMWVWICCVAVSSVPFFADFLFACLRFTVHSTFALEISPLRRISSFPCQPLAVFLLGQHFCCKLGLVWHGILSKLGTL